MNKPVLLFLLAFTVLSCLRTPEDDVHFLREIYYPELRGTIYQLDPSTRDAYWVNVIDLSTRGDFNAGHLPYAENIELHLFIDSSGYIVNGGRAITQRYDDQWEFVIYSSSNDTIAYLAAKTIEALGYTRVSFYEGGIADWQGSNGDFLHINEAGFNAWYASRYPFEDSLNVLVDVHPSSWYKGEEELVGHIPGAINIPFSSIADTTGGKLVLVEQGAALTTQIPDRSAKIIIYDSQNTDAMSAAFISAAMELGYDNLYLFPGGYDTWLERGNDMAP